MTDIHFCESCGEEHAEVTLAGPGGHTKFLCTAPECMMAAGICPNCHVDLEIKAGDDGETLYHCEQCDFDQTYEDLGQP